MNIFFLDYCPEQAAKLLIDRHVSTMIKESAQILSNCFTIKQLKNAPKSQKGLPRRHSYPHHPCCKWVQESRQNMAWVIINAAAMQREREFRFEDSPRHFSLSFIDWCAENIEDSIVPDVWELTPPALAMKDYSHCIVECPVESYQSFYREDKRFDSRGKAMDIYTKREKPAFWNIT